MPRTLQTAELTPQDALGVIARPRPAKASLEETQPDTYVSELFLDAVRKEHGKVEAGAQHVGKERANFTRDAKKWAAVMERLGPKFCARFGREMYEHFATALESPEQRLERLCDEIDQLTNEIRQGVRYIAQR